MEIDTLSKALDDLEEQAEQLERSTVEGVLATLNDNQRKRLLALLAKPSSVVSHRKVADVLTSSGFNVSRDRITAYRKSLWAFLDKNDDASPEDYA